MLANGFDGVIGFDVVNHVTTYLESVPLLTWHTM